MMPARVTPGAICLSSSSHFVAVVASNRLNPVRLAPGRAKDKFGAFWPRSAASASWKSPVEMPRK
jgi:hypothetical protein